MQHGHAGGSYNHDALYGNGLLRTSSSSSRHGIPAPSTPGLAAGQLGGGMGLAGLGLNALEQAQAQAQAQLIQSILQDPKALEAALLGQSSAQGRLDNLVAASQADATSALLAQLLQSQQQAGNQAPLAGGSAGPNIPALQAALSLQALSTAPSVPLTVTPQAPPPTSTQLLHEVTTTRSTLVQLLMSAYAFLSSASVAHFYNQMGHITDMYDAMHDLPVVQKRRRGEEMILVRNQLMKDTDFTQALDALIALRHHLHSLSRKLLLLNQAVDSVPLDLFLGSMCSELYHATKAYIPPEVLDFFGNILPHPKLAVLVFAEFTTVEPSSK